VVGYSASKSHWKKAGARSKVIDEAANGRDELLVGCERWRWTAIKLIDQAQTRLLRTEDFQRLAILVAASSNDIVSHWKAGWNRVPFSARRHALPWTRAAYGGNRRHGAAPDQLTAAHHSVVKMRRDDEYPIDLSADHGLVF
jgi:hypothetical protein